MEMNAEEFKSVGHSDSKYLLNRDILSSSCYSVAAGALDTAIVLYGIPVPEAGIQWHLPFLGAATLGCAHLITKIDKRYASGNLETVTLALYTGAALTTFLALKTIY